MFNKTTQIVADHIIPIYLERGERHILYMDVGQEVTDMAKKFISCEIDYEGKDGEMFPQWAILVSCPRSYNLIQWGAITYQINSILDAKAAAEEATAKAAEEDKITKEQIQGAIILSITFAIDPFATFVGIYFGYCLHKMLR